MYRILFFTYLASLLRTGSSQNVSTVSLEVEPTSWHRLKRTAGYFTESYRYRGGLYKRAKNQEHATYTCLEQSAFHCAKWTNAHIEQGDLLTCQCSPAVMHPYCESWICSPQKRASPDDCSQGICPEKSISDAVVYRCQQTSSEDRYCHEWAIANNRSNEIIRKESSVCLAEGPSKAFCTQWSTEAETDRIVESRICECIENKDHRYCQRWTCNHRWLVRCSVYGYGWCNTRFGIFAGGLIGLIFIAVSCWLTFAIYGRCQRLACFICAVSFLCFPWIASVLIWGGLDALLWVMLMWGIAISFGAALLYAIADNIDGFYDFDKLDTFCCLFTECSDN